MAAVEKVRSIVTFLEMRQWPDALATDPAFEQASQFTRVNRIAVGFYRHLYEEIGRAHAWVSRTALTDQQLKRIIHHPCTHVHVLYIDRTAAGFCELNYRRTPDVELTFLGLMPGYIGKGWGRHLLTRALLEARAQRVRHVRLQTCTLDHRRALPLYKSFGFEPLKLQTIELAVPRDRMFLIGQLAEKAS